VPVLEEVFFQVRRAPEVLVLFMVLDQPPAARVQVERLLLEWQGSDAVADAPKDPGLFPDWPAVRADVAAESRAIIDDVMFAGDGTLRSVLSTSKTTVTPALATFYGLGLSGQVDQPSTRRGLLLAGGFSAANAHFNATAPVKRGAIVRRKLLCQDLKLPTTPGLTIVVPAPDPTKTTRERFAAHSASPSCAGCHQLLDPIGFAMESFDAVGRFRTTENGKPIDTSGALVAAGDADGAFTDAAGMVALLANSKTVADCFQRQLFRFAAGRSGAEEERTFSDFVRARPSGQRGHVLELLERGAGSRSGLRRERLEGALVPAQACEGGDEGSDGAGALDQPLTPVDQLIALDEDQTDFQHRVGVGIEPGRLDVEETQPLEERSAHEALLPVGSDR
jgi:hypothetical protein